MLLAMLIAATMAAPAAATKVQIENYAFHQPSVTIVAGTTVTWTNGDDDPHTVVADDKSFASDGLGQGDTWSHTFLKPGTYHYHCSVHPFMKGTVIVTAPVKHS